jgi:hypothetical protein
VPVGRLTGKITDLGDVLRVEQVLVKGRRYLFTWRLGPPRSTLPADRATTGAAAPHNGRTDLIMDLQADKKVALSGAYTDEVGNPVAAPADAVVTYTVDDPTVINLTDNGDGTTDAAATGALGVANVHAEASWSGGSATGDLQIVVVAGLAERFNVVAGEPTEADEDA